MRNPARSLLENSINVSAACIPNGSSHFPSGDGITYSARKTYEHLDFEAGGHSLIGKWKTSIELGGDFNGQSIVNSIKYCQTIGKNEVMAFSHSIKEPSIYQLGKAAFRLFRGRSRLS